VIGLLLTKRSKLKAAIRAPSECLCPPEASTPGSSLAARHPLLGLNWLTTASTSPDAKTAEQPGSLPRNLDDTLRRRSSYHNQCNSIVRQHSKTWMPVSAVQVELASRGLFRSTAVYCCSMSQRTSVWNLHYHGIRGSGPLQMVMPGCCRPGPGTIFRI
jgi:hypothetical protein